MDNSSKSWWRHGVIYQIYPRSFRDSNGDGVGDLPGVMERLDYLAWLGVDAIWLSPIYPSPMADFGYDVSDFTGIHPIFGTNEQFDTLVAQVHQRGLKLILDFVPNHTSDQHPWFQEARRSRDSARRDWYIWRDPAPDGGPPNNWLSNFGGSAWEFDAGTGQYYYHAFLREQPDLNWRNPAVREAMYDALRHWMARGVDGFRVDVIWHLIKDDEFRDNPVSPGWVAGMDPFHQLVPVHTADRPEVHEVVREMRQVVDEFDDRVLIGEIYLPLERLMAYYGVDLTGAHMPFNFQLIDAPWHARTVDRMIRDYEAALPPGGWPNWVLGNHDKPRIASRVGSAQARVAAMLLLTLRGTPTLYYGDELGMENVHIRSDQVQDPFERNVPGKGLGRDPERTPMRWDASANAGFTSGEPWLPIGDDVERINVEAETDDETSMLTLCRNLIALRRGEDALSEGAFEAISAEGDVLAYQRIHGGNRFAIVLNFGATPARVALPDIFADGRVRLSTFMDRGGASKDVGTSLEVRGHEGVIVQMDPRRR
ncbi:alpha-amylase [Skermanella stibiiresistens SB22]|uniref:Alpha-amylase n=1 Tax=Skermanella stibiiresistens SB22 TaxID=1385369 RepID=W9H3N2_9PROT|nr:alpha-amylase family glycosyl hydrolase [Skermanella stibiiresistens]EWY39337.1 alpha-amylase [Skermanella stibiiresistens SB22]